MLPSAHPGSRCLALLPAPEPLHGEGGDPVGEQRQRRHVVALCSQQHRQGHGIQTAATHVLAEGDAEEAGGR